MIWHSKVWLDPRWKAQKCVCGSLWASVVNPPKITVNAFTRPLPRGSANHLREILSLERTCQTSNFDQAAFRINLSETTGQRFLAYPAYNICPIRSTQTIAQNSFSKQAIATRPAHSANSGYLS